MNPLARSLHITVLDVFEKLTYDIPLYTPPHALTDQLIILGTWLGAVDKHIAKYVELHQNQFYTSRLLKSEKPSSLPWPQSSTSYRTAYLRNFPPKILLHIFSNSGIGSATYLLTILRRNLHAPTPVVGLICDSVPMGAGYRKTYNAFMHSFPSTFLNKFAASALAHTLLVLLFLSVAMARYEHPEDFWRKAILDKSLTGWRDVVAHAEIARERGWDAREVVLEDPPHCNHLKYEPRLYEDLVVRMREGGKV
ncbi:hypothetical protein K458DRAFT_436312 [Lentithecium fluviatile CBS 122367]|uniref:Indole-diterpene biosynthesis protein-like protein PaxU n=1 Tax=Lentithecium fluviatile CBS 122367 TaxID=1168545 RepID=A0A6G1IIN9_9PLEO|nr:hypothetical protein K458DRAFT_436312 [Lentithecium fluviatile CBS 122367]